MEDSKFDKFKLILCNFDFLGFKMEYLYRGKNKYKSCYGGLITIICSILLTYIFINMSSDCFNKLNPTVREAIFYEQKAILQEKDFFFGLYFRDGDHNIINDINKYLTIEGLLKNNTLSLSKEENIHFPFKRCESKNFAKYDTTDIKISNFLCLDIKDNFILMNSNNEFPKISLSISIKECDTEEKGILKIKLKKFKFFKN